MRNWTRDMAWGETRLRWVPPSPNISYARSPLYYVATGMVGELGNVKTGVGGSAPFEMIASKWLNAERFSSYLDSLYMPGVSFRPFRRGRAQGALLSIEPKAPADPTALGVHMLDQLNRSSGGAIFARSRRSQLDLFFKVYGSSSIRSQLQRGVPVSSIVGLWKEDVTRFRSQRAAYLIY
ncbi:MAG: hypothetical protein ABR514_10910 [Chthoniobacterales bacterium]